MANAFIKTSFTGIFKNMNFLCDTIYGTKYSRMDLVNFLKAVFHKIYLVHSRILCLV